MRVRLRRYDAGSAILLGGLLGLLGLTGCSETPASRGEEGEGEGEGEGGKADGEGEGEGTEGEGEGEGTEGEGEGTEGEGEGTEGEGEGAEGEGEGTEGEGEGTEGEGEGTEGEGEGEPELGCLPSATPFPEVPAERQGRYLLGRSFPSRFLPGTRTITVLLPEEYDREPAKHYPVLYLHDGQNLFDAGRAAFRVEWQADEAADALVRDGVIPPLILVGVDNAGGRRTEEYTPSFDPSLREGGDAANYARFLVEEVKPWVDAVTRTRCGRLDTGVAGSSLGGLVSLYLLREHPRIFGRVGAISTSLWWNGWEALGWTDALLADWRAGARLWIDAGTDEGNDSGTEEGGRLDDDGDGMVYMVDDSRTLCGQLLAGGLTFGEDVGCLEALHAEHNEASWAYRLPAILTFLWGELPPPAPETLRLRAYVTPVGVGRETALAVEAAYPGPLELTLPLDEVALSSSAPDVARLQGAGTLVGVAAGETRLQATAAGLTAERRVPVVASEADWATLAFVIHVPAGTPAAGPVFLAGSPAELGSWDPAGLALEPLFPGVWGADVPFPKGTEIRMKVTRGSWETVEKSAAGGELDDRVISADSGRRVELWVQRWADQP